MKKRIIFIAMLLIALVASDVMAVIAAEPSTALYKGVIRERNTSYTATNVSVPFSLSTEFLIDAGYINADCSDTNIALPNGDKIPYMPAVDTGTDWFIFDPQIGQTSSKEYTLHLGGGDDLEGDIVYFPGTSGMTVPNAASLTLGNNFDVEVSGYVDTSAGANKNLVYKEDNFKLYVSDENEITASIAYQNLQYTTSTTTLRPNGNHTGTGYEAVSDNSDSTYIINTPAQRFFTLPSFNPSRLIDINSITVYIRASAGTGDTYRYVTPQIKIGENTYNIQNYGFKGSSIVTQSKELLVNPTTTEWTINDIQNLLLGYNTSDSGYIRVYELWITVSYNYYATSPIFWLSASSTCSSNEHTIKTIFNEAALSLYIDGNLKDTALLSESSILYSTANNWSFFTNNSMPYMRSAKISVGGNLKGSWAWENDTTFHDLSGNGNHATPTFRTTTSDPDVSATLISLGAIKQAKYGAGGGGDPSQIITTTMTIPPEMYTASGIRLPGAELLNDLLDNAGIPQTLFWYPLLFGLAALAGYITYYFARDIMIQGIVNASFLAFFGVMGGIPFWVVIPFALMILSIIISRKTVSL